MRSFILLFALAFSSAFAVQYQATTATLSGGAVLSGDHVKMNAGNMSWTVNVSAAGMYDIVINYKLDEDYKAQYLVVNGSNAGEIAFTKSTAWKNVPAVARLNQGNNTVAINNHWGYVDIRYIDVTLHENIPFNLNKNLANANANSAAKNMFAFMQDNFQKKVISGVMTNDVLSGSSAVTLNNQSEVRFIRQSSNNKTPALVGFDFMHGTGKEYEDANGGWFKNYTDATISLAKELYQRGGIPAFCWHWRDPLKNSKGFYSPSASDGDKTNFDLTTACSSTSCSAWNTNSNAYKAMIEDIDKVAGYLKELQTAGVAVLWRPIHEASGGWFWWGYKGAAPFKLLYKHMFDRLTTTHGLNNLIWVWNSEGGDSDWYPGDNYVDIIGRDAYVNDHSSLIGEFEKLKNLFGTKKMIALSENGPVPYPANLVNDGAGWSFFMPWYGNYTTQSNTASDWNTIMNHSYVITLEDMPGWGNYVPPSSSSSRGVSSSSSRGISSSSSGGASSSSNGGVSSSSNGGVSSSSNGGVSSSSNGEVSSSSGNGVVPSSSSSNDSGESNTSIKVLSSIPSAKFQIRSMGNGALLVESHAKSEIYLYDTKGNLAQKLQVQAGSSIVMLHVPAGIYVVKNAATKQTQVVMVR